MSKKIKDDIIQFIKPYYENNVVRYIFFGVLSTLVNFVFFALFINIFMWPVLISNTLAIALAIIFAYYVNARCVFYSKASGYKAILKELSTFVSARLITMIIEIFGVELLVGVIKLDAMVSKIFINIIVLILNYIFSAFIFKKK